MKLDKHTNKVKVLGTKENISVILIKLNQLMF